VDTASDGLFLAGACQGPKDIPDSVAQGAAAAAGALSLIDRGRFVLEPVTAAIDAERCAGCKLCLLACPSGAIRFDPEARVARKCDLCGGDPQCVKHCISGALEFEEAGEAFAFRRAGFDARLKLLLGLGKAGQR
jgi:heterodisulfide reductase subunit A